jgi:hypothetical protein
VVEAVVGRSYTYRFSAPFHRKILLNITCTFELFLHISVSSVLSGGGHLRVGSGDRPNWLPLVPLLTIPRHLLGRAGLWGGLRKPDTQYLGLGLARPKCPKSRIGLG